MSVCNQCGKPAVVKLGSNPLCVGCYALLQQAETARLEALNDRMRLTAAAANSCLDEMDAATGLNIGSSMKMQIPSRTPQQYNTVHSVNVQGGVVGVINTGEVRKIAVAIGNTEKQGNTELAATLKAFTDSLIADESLNEHQRRDMVDQLGLLSAELTAPKESRRPAVIKPVLEGLGKAVTISTGLIALWDKLHPLLKEAFK